MSDGPITDGNDEDDLYFFETDHLALRGNKDYSEVLKNLVILCAQRKQALKDYNKAVELKAEALANPAEILEKIIQGESLGMPEMLSIPELPVIDYSKYDVKISEESFKLIYSDTVEPAKKKYDALKKESKISHGRWTTEEQKRLEELLQTFPPEPIEMRRFKKIADALGNRTIQQVSSRVQKYFLKLYKAGLPIPGRVPKSAEKYKRTALHKHQRHNHYLWKPTTFFPHLCVPVVMNDLDSVPGPSSKMPEEVTKPTVSSNYLIPTGYHEETEHLSHKTEAELQLDLLRRVRKIKLREEERGGVLYRHIGYKCDCCSEEPIVGTRWHCNSCKTKSVDFCTDCVLTQMYSDSCHPLSHNLVLHSDYLSDSESNNGSAPDSWNCNNGSSDSSDSEFNMEDVDDEMSDVSDKVKSQVVSNGISGDDETRERQDCNDLSKMDFVNFKESDDLFGAGLGSDLFSEIENISYNYLHSNLLLDKE